MTRLMEKELIHMLMVPITKETGLMTSNMELGWSHGQMEQSMRVNTEMGRRMEEEN